jgi:hypothetical protein
MPVDRSGLSVRILLALALCFPITIAAEAQPTLRAPGPDLVSAGEDFDVPKPPRRTSKKARKELAQILRLQRKLTKKEKKLIERWSDGPATIPWTEVNLDQIVIHRPGAFPTRTARGLALLHIGMLDALVAAQEAGRGQRRPPPYKADDDVERLAPRGSSYPDPVAAIAGAAERILIHLFPQERAGTFSNLAQEAGRSRLLAGVSYASDVREGRKLGQAVGDLVVAYGLTDGHMASAQPILDARVCSTPSCGEDAIDQENEQNWVPTPVHYQWPPTDPATSRWRTYLLDSPSQFRPPLPYAYGSSQFCDELAEVKAANDTANQDQRELGFFWDDGPGSLSPAGHWNDIAIDLVEGRGTGTAATARIFALMNAAILDAFVSVWDAKYAYWTQRPVTAIRERTSVCGGSLHDPEWFPNLLTPPFPGYPSGHSGESAAAARVLQYFFPDSPGASDGLGDQPEARGTIDQIADEVALSRMLAGIHVRSDNEDALVLGRRIGGLAIGYARDHGWSPIQPGSN